MGAIKDLWNSEKGLIAILLIIGATVLTALDKLAIDGWTDYTMWIAGLYFGAKTLTSGVAMIATGKDQPTAAPEPAPSPAPSPPPG